MRPILCKLLKKHIEKMSAFRLSIMLMKTSELNRSLHYVDENKGEGRLRGWRKDLARISRQVVDADASGSEPQRGALTKPTPKARVCGRRSDAALKGRATLDATDCSSPSHGSTFRVKAHL
jgi:hypothetical protein